jgi:hypothetical protein
MGRRTETKTEPRSEGDAERAFRAQQTQPFSSTTVADRVSSPLLVSSRSSRRLSRVSHAQREQSLWSLASIDDGARDPMTGRCGWTDGDGGLKCLDAQLKPPDRPMSGGL